MNWGLAQVCHWNYLNVFVLRTRNFGWVWLLEQYLGNWRGDDGATVCWRRREKHSWTHFEQFGTHIFTYHTHTHSRYVSITKRVFEQTLLHPARSFVFVPERFTAYGLFGLEYFCVCVCVWFGSSNTLETRVFCCCCCCCWPYQSILKHACSQSVDEYTQYFPSVRDSSALTRTLQSPRQRIYTHVLGLPSRERSKEIERFIIRQNIT